MNDSYLLAPWADIHYASDPRWHAWHTAGVPKPALGLTAEDVRERWAACREQHAVRAVPAAAAADSPSPAPAAGARHAPAPAVGAAVAPVAAEASQPTAASAAPQAPAPALAAGAAVSADPIQPSLLDDTTPAAAAPSPAPAPAAARSEYQDARASREKAQAAMAQIELRRLQGQVLDAEPVLRAVADAHIAARNKLMALADRVTPLVAAETDPRRVWELINAEAERVAEDMQRAALQLAERRRAEVVA